MIWQQSSLGNLSKLNAAIWLTILATARCASAGDPSPTAAQIRQLFDAGWKPSQAAYTAAQEHYDQAKRLAPGDERVSFAMALVAVQNHRPADASKYLGEAVSNGRSLLPILRARIWLDVVRRDTDSAKTDIRDLARQLSADNLSANRADNLESAHWLGIVLGYYSGPGKTQISHTDQVSLDAEVSAQLKGPLATSFAAGRNAFDERFKKLQTELAEARKEVKATNEAKLPDERQQIETAIRDCYDKRRRASRDVENIRNGEDNVPVLEMYNSIQQQLKELKNDRDFWESRSHRGGGLKGENTDKSDSRADDAKYNLDETNRKGRAVEDRLSALAPQMQKIQAQLAPLLEIIQQQESLLQSLKKKQKQLAQPASENDDATRALDAAAKSFTTYAGIDLDQEKKRILESYGTPGQ